MEGLQKIYVTSEQRTLLARCLQKLTEGGDSYTEELCDLISYLLEPVSKHHYIPLSQRGKIALFLTQSSTTREMEPM